MQGTETSKILYSIGDPVQEAHVIGHGPVTLSFPGNVSLTIDGTNIIVGTLELLLEKEVGRSLTREANTYIPVDVRPEVLRLADLPVLLEDFDLALQANMFIAKLLRAANDQISSLQATTEEAKKYRLLAMVYHRFTELISSFGNSQDLSDLTDLANINRKEEAYKLGAVLNVSNVRSPVLVDDVPVGKFVDHYKAGQLICEEGQQGETLFVLLRGAVSVYIGRLEIASISEVGQAFGELSLLLDGKRTATLKAKSDSDLYVVEKENLEEFHNVHPKMFSGIASTLANRLSASLSQIEMLKAQSKGAGDEDNWSYGTSVLRVFVNSLEYIKLKNPSPQLDEVWRGLRMSMNSLLKT